MWSCWWSSLFLWITYFLQLIAYVICYLCQLWLYKFAELNDVFFKINNISFSRWSFCLLISFILIRIEVKMKKMFMFSCVNYKLLWLILKVIYLTNFSFSMFIWFTKNDINLFFYFIENCHSYYIILNLTKIVFKIHRMGIISLNSHFKKTIPSIFGSGPSHFVKWQKTAVKFKTSYLYLCIL